MTTTLDDALTVETFASAVRGELFDLDDEAINELTDGLEADLAEKLADGESLGDPTAYAAELRAAAGLPTRKGSSISHNVRENLADLRSRFDGAASNPVVSFFVSMRPVWWLLRGIVLFALLNVHRQWSAIPNDPLQILMLVALIVASVQWGRGKWLPWAWSRPALVVASVIAVLTVPVVASYTALQVSDYWFSDDEASMGMLAPDGSQVTNIFAYGPDGELIRGVQLFDQNGNPLSVLPSGWGNTATLYDDSLPEGQELVPSADVAGRPGWNVYPLQSVPYEAVNPVDGTVDELLRSDVAPPFASVQQLLGYERPGPSATSVPEPTTAP